MSYHSSDRIEFGGAVTGIVVHDRKDRQSKSAPTAVGKAEMLVGVACRFGAVHPYNDGYDVFQKGCFARTLASEQTVRLLLGHDEGKLITTSLEGLKLESDNDELRVSWAIPDTPAGELVSQAVKQGGIAEMSVGFTSVCDRKDEHKGRPLRIITDAALYEISLVAKGAVPGTSAKIYSADEFEARKNLRKIDAYMASTDRLLKSLETLSEIYSTRERLYRKIANQL